MHCFIPAESFRLKWRWWNTPRAFSNINYFSLFSLRSLLGIIILLHLMKSKWRTCSGTLTELNNLWRQWPLFCFFLQECANSTFKCIKWGKGGKSRMGRMLPNESWILINHQCQAWLFDCVTSQYNDPIHGVMSESRTKIFPWNCDNKGRNHRWIILFAHPLLMKNNKASQWYTHKPATRASKNYCYVGIEILYCRNYYICNFESIWHTDQYICKYITYIYIRIYILDGNVVTPERGRLSPSAEIAGHSCSEKILCHSK